MNEKTFTTLDFPVILQQAAQQTHSEVGKRMMLSLRPKTSVDEVRHLLYKTQTALDIQRLKGGIPVSDIQDVTTHLKRLTIGASLNGLEIAQIGRILRTTSELKRFFDSLDDSELSLEALSDEIAALQPIPEVSGHIHQALNDDGSVCDDASPQLRQLRFQIRHTEQQVREKLETMIRGKQTKYLSDAVITMRNDRYVIPVKQEYRGQFGGVVHDQSASGQTLFIEPKQVVDLNNRRQQAKLAEKQEIQRILYALCDEISPYTEEIQQNMTVIAKLDVVNAKARFAKSMKAIIPTVNDKHDLSFKQARHPLIDPQIVVANDIELGQHFKVLVITGPNTGGKTLTLKTVGLLQLMGQSGFAIPAHEDSQLAVFEHIAVDIGDEQSIEQNLSTFSGHMVNIIEILQHLNENSLVLFDELGAGTDPQEGAALAMAILDEVRHSGACAIATTHYPELKLYGYNHPDTKNASMEFDVESLKPTYRLLIGTPGRSNAFEISQRLGLDSHIVQHARDFIDDETKDLETSIQELETARQKMEEEYDEAHQLVEEATQLRQELKEKYDSLNQERQSLMKAAQHQANQVVAKAEEQANSIIEDLKARQKEMEHHQVKEHEMIEARTQLKNMHYTEEEEKLRRNKVLQREKRKKALHPGDEVMVETYGQRGTLVKQFKDGDWEVQLGVLKMKLAEDELTLLQSAEKQQQASVTVHRSQSKGLSTRLDLRGHRYEEAMREVEQYLDQALVAGYPSVTIVHGKGTGALRTGIWELLKHHRQVKAFNYAPANSGGNGATIVEFK